MKTFLFLVTGFEEIEAVATIDILRRAGLDVISVSMEEDLAVKGSHNMVVKADTLFADNNYSDAEMLILPGGTIRLCEFEQLNHLLTNHNKEGKKLAAICAAPVVLGKLNLLQGKRATVYPGYESYLHGATIVTESVVKDGNILTGRGPGWTFDFALAIVEELLGKEKAQQVATGMLLR